MILSDRDLKHRILTGKIGFDPLDLDNIQPSSVDVCVSNIFRVFETHSASCIDVREPVDLTREVIVPEGAAFQLQPGEFVLGSTLERITVPVDLAARIEGKSSLGRLGLMIHSTAGFIDPGFQGNITLELSNVAPLPIKIYPGMRIGQVSFMMMSTPPDHPYGSRGVGSKYQGQTGTVSSRYYENFEENGEHRAHR